MRLFVALDVPPPARSVLTAAVAPLRQRYPALRWNPPDMWHLTLAFLGDTAVGGRLRAQVALQAVARAARPCTIAVDGRLGRFGDRVLWVAIESSEGGVSTLARAVAGGLRAAGIAIDDRPFRAHLTLARARRGQRVPREPLRLDAPGLPVGWQVSTVLLMSSQLGGAGSRYRRVATWPLGIAAPPA